jgi:hypothetical protein
MNRPLVAALAAAIALAALAGAAEKRGKQKDAIWSNPDFKSFGIRSIGVIPPVSYDHNLQNEKSVETALASVLKGAKLRWIASLPARTLITRDPGGDSLLKAVRARLLDSPRVDSLLAPELCRRLRTDAVMSLRVDRMEKLEMEFNQAGRPSTSVQVTGSLVDSTGALLWSATGSETAEGPYHDPSAAVIGVKSSGLNTTPITGQGGAPSFEEVLTTLFQRWADRFPTRADSTAAPAGAPGP